MDGSSKTWDDPTEVQISDLVSELNRRHRFLVIDRLQAPNDEHYLQFCLCEDGSGWDVEYRAGSAESHWCAHIDNVDEYAGLVMVGRIFSTWVADGAELRAMLPWCPLE